MLWVLKWLTLFPFPCLKIHCYSGQGFLLNAPLSISLHSQQTYWVPLTLGGPWELWAITTALSQCLTSAQVTVISRLCCVALSLSRVWLCVTSWTVAGQAPLSMGILLVRILYWVAMPSSRGSSQPWDQTQVSHFAGGFFSSWCIREAPSCVWFLTVNYLLTMLTVFSLSLLESVIQQPRWSSKALIRLLLLCFI